MSELSYYEGLLGSLNSEKFKSLRTPQKYVLNRYRDEFIKHSDIAIELPTGAGKALIALLIAESWRIDKKKVAILSANKTLARQMQKEAGDLGISSVLMQGRGIDIPVADKRAYHRSVSVAIMNYWVYFNQNPVIDPADLLIMDDAHLAEHCLHSLYSVEIRRNGHDNLYTSIISELAQYYPEYTVLSDALANDNSLSTPPELLSFIDQIEFSDRLIEIIDSSPYTSSDADLKYRWGRIRPAIREANIYLSLSSIWIRPYIYPLLGNLHYNQVSQKIYSSATIGDPGDLCRRLGVGPIKKIPVPDEDIDKTSGRRFVIMNRLEDDDIPSRLQEVILTCLSVHPKSVWLCSSEVEARSYQARVSEWLNGNGFVGHPNWLLTPLGDEVDQFKRSICGHLFVAGRFDGMDFNADECRLVVLTTLPKAINIQEDFLTSYLRDSGFMLRRLNHRIIQALGRCNRSDSDFGVYVLADRRFATHFGRESNLGALPKNFIAEIDYAQDTSEIDSIELCRKAKDFLLGNFIEFDASISAIASTLPEPGSHEVLEDTSADEVLGWTSMFSSQNYEIASDRFQSCWEKSKTGNRIEIGALYGWQWAKALYLNSLRGEPSARDKALSVLDAAIRRGGASSWFNRMRASLNRARKVGDHAITVFDDEYSNLLIRSFDELLEKSGAKGTKLDRWIESTTSMLESGHHNEFQEGLERLGTTLGYHSTRPQYGTATDCRWRGIFGNARELITIEAKIEHSESGLINPSDVGQAHNQLARAITEFERQGYFVRGIITTHLSALRPEAEASAGVIKIVKKEAIIELWKIVVSILQQYRRTWSLHDISARRVSAQSIRTKLPSSGWLIRSIDDIERVVGIESLLKEWGK
jgi:hypothetical protein